MNASNVDIPATLEEIASRLRQSASLETMPRKEQIKLLCKLTGVSLEELAFARLYKNPQMTAQQLAIQMGVTRRTLYNWPEVARLLTKRKDLM
jgi:predicted DNA-binding protein (UPF0251 family)